MSNRRDLIKGTASLLPLGAAGWSVPAPALAQPDLVSSMAQVGMEVHPRRPRCWATCGEPTPRSGAA